jgi:CHAT domain-containing protein
MIEANGGSTKSYLLLRDWMDWPLAMNDLQQLRRESRSRSFLAYLSAYSTGNTAESALLNETAHFMSFFQRAGFRHVIGTLWPVSDRTSVGIARTVYQTLVEEGMVDGVVATALHRATRTLRDASNSGMAAASGERDPKQARGRNKKSVGRNREFGWVPYFHYGI